MRGSSVGGWRGAEPSLAGATQRALLAVAGNCGQLAQRQLCAAEVVVDHVPAHLVDEAREGGAFTNQSSLQCSGVHRELGGDRFECEAARRQHAPNHSTDWF